MFKNRITPLQTKENNPVFYLLSATLIYAICLFYPQKIELEVLLAIICSLAFIARPEWGVFFIIAVHPIVMCQFTLFWEVGHPIEIIPSVKGPYIQTPMEQYTVPLYLFQVASVMLLPALVFHHRPSLLQNSNIRYKKIIYITLTAFFIWGIITSLLARYPYIAFFSFSRFVSIGIIISYMIRFIQSTEEIRKAMIAYCCSAVILVFFAYYGTYYGFMEASTIWNNFGVTISQVQGLANGSIGFIAERQGMIPGFGLSAKHELSTFLAAAFFYSLYLWLTAKNKTYSTYYLVVSFAILLALFYGPSKLTLAGIIMATIVVALLNRFLRSHVLLIVLILACTMLFTFFAAKFTRPPYAKNMEMTSQSFKVVNSSSEFSNSFKGRLAKMRNAAKFIKSSYGVGIGADMLHYHPIFSDVHGHNLFITLFAEYGFPAVMSVLILGILLTCQVLPIITSQASVYDIGYLTSMPIIVSFIVILFEYSLDCNVWSPPALDDWSTFVGISSLCKD